MTLKAFNLLTVATGGITINSTAITSGTAGRLLFENSSNQVSEDSGLVYDATNDQLQLPTVGSGAGILIGGDTQLYRSGADTLRSPDSLVIDTAVTGARFIPSGSTVPTNGMNLPAANTLGFSTNSTDAMRLTALQGLAIGGESTAFTTNYLAGSLSGLAVVAPTVSAFFNASFTSALASLGPVFQMIRGRGTAGSGSIVAADDAIGSISFNGAGSSSVYAAGAAISAFVDGTPGASADMPGRLIFLTTPDGSGTPAEAVRIDSTKLVSFAKDRSIRFNNQTSSAAASLGTLANAPAAGDPGYWLKINIGGTNYAIPCWAG